MCPDDAIEARVLVLTRPGCCLCDDAIAIVGAVCGELGVGWHSRNVDEDPELRREWNDHVPVTFVDGVRHDMWKVEADRLRRALAG